jgi:Chlorophyll A-B binding protein
VEYAERINGRACMIGFVGLIIVEAIAHKGLFEMLGFTVGQGLGFEF